MPAKRKIKRKESKSYKKNKNSEDKKTNEKESEQTNEQKNNVNEFMCADCGLQFKRKENVETHKINAHSPLFLKYLCPLWPACSKIRLSTGNYSTYENLVAHFRKHHKTEPIPEKNTVKIVKFKRSEMNEGTFDLLFANIWRKNFTSLVTFVKKFNFLFNQVVLWLCNQILREMR